MPKKVEALHLKVIEIKKSRNLGGGADYLIADHDTSPGDVLAHKAAVYCQTHDRLTADIFVNSVNFYPGLVASLRAILPFAESRAEDMIEIAEEAEAESRATAADAREDADKAVAAVDDAKALLASLGAEG